MQILYDANEASKDQLEKMARINNDALKCHSFRAKDFFEEGHVFKRAAMFTSPIINEKDRNVEFLKALQHFENKELDKIN